MTSHDQLSKSLIRTFFADFLRLAVPEFDHRLQAADAVFLDKEAFTDWPAGDRREMDLLAKVPVQKQERPLLALFRYRVLGLSGCPAQVWLSRPEPIAWAFAALMRPGSWSRPELKLECLRRIARSGVSGLRKQILVDWVETYVQLSGQDAAELRWLLDLEGNEEIKAMELTWLGKAEVRGMEAATQQAVERMRRVVLRQMEQRFGAIPPRERRTIEAIGTLEPLAELAEKMFVVDSIHELGLS